MRRSPWKHYDSKHQMFPGNAVMSSLNVPKFERVLERSMMACLLGLFKTERLAREMSAVTRVIDILKQELRKNAWLTRYHGLHLIWDRRTQHVFLMYIKTKNKWEANSCRKRIYIKNIGIDLFIWTHDKRRSLFMEITNKISRHHSG